jgi:hypothetical protein
LGDFADRFATFAEARETFFEAGLLAATLRLGWQPCAPIAFCVQRTFSQNSSFSLVWP